MPRYFIDIGDDLVVLSDEVGEELPDLRTAHEMAMALLPDLARDALAYGDNQSFFVVIRDEEGAELFKGTLQLSAQWVARNAGTRQ